jgi:hypothetical protein
LGKYAFVDCLAGTLSSGYQGTEQNGHEQRGQTSGDHEDHDGTAAFWQPPKSVPTEGNHLVEAAGARPSDAVGVFISTVLDVEPNNGTNGSREYDFDNGNDNGGNGEMCEYDHGMVFIVVMKVARKGKVRKRSEKIRKVDDVWAGVIFFLVPVYYCSFLPTCSISESRWKLIELSIDHAMRRFLC